MKMCRRVEVMTIQWNWFLWLVLFPQSVRAAMNLIPYELAASGGLMESAIAVVGSVANQYQSCSQIIFADGTNYDHVALARELNASHKSRGVAVFDLLQDQWYNTTLMENLIQEARQLRLTYPCVMIVVMSDDLAFLGNFAEMSLKNRLLAGSSRTMVVGQLDRQEVLALAAHWTFSMYDSLIILPRQDGKQMRWDLHCFLPFSSSGKQLVQVGSWESSRGLVLGLDLFPQKFTNFHGASINATALPYKPYWTKDTLRDNNGVTNIIYSGSDRHMLEVLASALNFSIRVLPVKTWDEVIQRVSERVSFVSSVVHMVLPQRLERVDFTRTYEHGINIAFAMAKPVLRPQWQSLYYPLASQVWLFILGILLVVPLCFIWVTRKSGDILAMKSSNGLITLGVFGTLLGQTMSANIPATASARIMLCSWLIFAFIIATAYRGNLIASLIAPRYPPRPESLEGLVEVAERVTMPSYGAEFRDFLRGSEFHSFRKLGAILEVGVSVTQGLNMALKQRRSHIDGTRYLEQQIAEHFTEADGSSKLYVGREGVLPGLNAWPIPHDAPYKGNFDAVILAVIEGGLYNKWMKDMLDQARKEGRMKRKEQQALSEEKDPSGGDDQTKALTIVHLQGPLMIMALGSGAGLLTFIAEIVASYFLVNRNKVIGFG